MLKQFYFWIAIIWTLVIGVLCLVKFGKLPSMGLSNIDKYVHFSFHFIFTGLWFLYFYQKNNTVVKTFFIIFLMSFCYGIAIELAQEFFTETRKADVLDVLANATGSLIAIVTIIIHQKINIKNNV